MILLSAFTPIRILIGLDHLNGQVRPMPLNPSASAASTSSESLWKSQETDNIQYENVILGSFLMIRKILSYMHVTYIVFDIIFIFNACLAAIILYWPMRMEHSICPLGIFDILLNFCWISRFQEYPSTLGISNSIYCLPIYYAQT